MNKRAVWFGRAVWLGILADWVLAIPAIFIPNETLEFVGQRPSQDPIWTAFAALLLVLLAAFYIPGANNPYRYQFNAWLAVLARPPGVIFFLWLNPGLYPVFGYLDLTLFLIQMPLLILTMAGTPRPKWKEIWMADNIKNDDVFQYHGSTFNEVKEAAFSGPYNELPYHRGVGLSTFLQFINDSRRNMSDRRDIRPKYDKLIHANGISFTGLWRIDQDSPYTGYFAKGSQGLLLARASVAGPRITRGHRRALGIGGKVFPTMDPNEKLKPGNFVVVSKLSGSKAKHVTNIEMSNMPDIGLDPAANFVNRVIFRLMDTRPFLRMLFPISTLGMSHNDKIITPDLMMLKVAEGTPKIDARDFRDELRLENYPDNKLVYTINIKSFADTEWARLGTIEFTEYAISEGGDKRIHFWIPRDVPASN